MSVRLRTVIGLVAARGRAGRFAWCGGLVAVAIAAAVAVASLADERAAFWLPSAILGIGTAAAGLKWVLPPEIPEDARRCLRCGHDRRGLPSPAHRCPECGQSGLEQPGVAELNLAAAPGCALIAIGSAALIFAVWAFGMVARGVFDV